MSNLDLNKVVLYVFAIFLQLSCQKANLRPSSVMVENGSDPKKDLALVGETNWIAHISTKRHFCTGFLLSPNLVMTAAHCVTDRDGKKIQDRFQVTFQLSRFKSVYEGQVHSIHPNYQPDLKLNAQRYLTNDFAIIKLNGGVREHAILGKIPVILTNTHQVKSAIAPGQKVLFFGYGNQSTKGAFSYGYGVPIPKSVCFMSLPEPFGLQCQNAHVEKFCISAEDSEARTIGGDSGGPVTRYTDGRHQVLGIIVHGSPSLSFFETFDTPSVNAWLSQALAAP